MKKPDTPRAMATELHLNFSGSREPIQIVQIQIGECETLKSIKIPGVEIILGIPLDLPSL
jgi:hypothetical protein